MAAPVDYGGLANPFEGGDDVPSGEESDEELVRLTPAPAAERSDVWTGFRRRAARIAAGLVAYAVVLTVVDVTRVTTINTDAAAEDIRLRVALPAAGAPMLLKATASFDRPDDCAAPSATPRRPGRHCRRSGPRRRGRRRPWTCIACARDGLRPSSFSSCAAGERARRLATFTSRATGFLRFDGAPYADVRGAPSWALGSLATFPGSEASHDKVFEGLFAIDAEGWVVWAYAACAPEAWDRTAAGAVVVLSRAGGGCAGAAEDALDYHHVSSVSVSETTGDFIVASRNLTRSGRSAPTAPARAGNSTRRPSPTPATPSPRPTPRASSATGRCCSSTTATRGRAARPPPATTCRRATAASPATNRRVLAPRLGLCLPEAADSPAAKAKDVFNAVGGSVAPRDDGGRRDSRRGRGGAVGGLVLDVDAAGNVAATAALPRDGSSSAFAQNAYRFVPWENIAGESAASPLSGGAWELYKCAFAVGPGAAPRALDVAGAVLGPPEAVLNLGCDGRKASVDLAPHGPQLHWVGAADRRRRARAAAAAALAAAHDDAAPRGGPGATTLALRFAPSASASAAAAAAESDARGPRSRDDWGGWSHWLDRHVGLKYVPGGDEDAACDVSRRVSAALESRAVAQRTAYDFGPAGELHWYVAYGPTAVEYHVRDCVAATTNGNAEVCMCAPTNNDADYAALTGGLSCYDPPANAGTTRGVDDDGAS
ncbi:hypothetical protein JL720_9980 [Aureococcus anophagefferens]|nr:hypothetical protein JL720_9980 [Aureococcus anophagefferens]